MRRSVRVAVCVSGWRWDSASDKVDYQQDETDDEENPGNLACDRRDPAEAQGSGDQSQDQKDERVVQHG
jgi:hypothetical protein